MVSVAQLVRVPGCGPGGQGFKSLHSPLNKLKMNNLQLFIDNYSLLIKTAPSSNG